MHVEMLFIRTIVLTTLLFISVMLVRELYPISHNVGMHGNLSLVALLYIAFKQSTGLKCYLFESLPCLLN